MALRPDSPSLLYDIGVVQHRRGDLDEAIANYSAAIEQDKHYTWAFINRGNARLAKQQYAGARDDFRETPFGSIRRSFSPHYGLGTVEYECKNYDEAIKEFGVVTDRAVAFAAAFNQRGRTWEAKGDNERSRRLRACDSSRSSEPGRI